MTVMMMMRMMESKMKAVVYFVILGVLSSLDFGGTAVDLSAPTLVEVPPPLSHFSNGVGLTLSCGGSGPLPLSIHWLDQSGQELGQIPGIRDQLVNGSLHFSPFKPEEYIPAVHNGQYRCSVRSPVGTFLSPVFAVRAILDHPFELVISSPKPMEEMMEGSPALLVCDVTPAFYTQFVRVIGWKTIDQFGHESEITRDASRYQVVESGALVVLAAKYHQLFVCIGQSVLNRRVVASPPFLFKPRAAPVGGGLPPRRISPAEEHLPLVLSVESGSSTELICLGVSSPPPTFRWEKLEKGKFLPVSSLLNSGLSDLGPLLRFSPVLPLNNGSYRCEVANAFGSFTADFSLLVPEIPKVVLHGGPNPSRRARPGDNIELSCVLDQQFPGRAIDFVWFKDGKPVQSSARLRLTPHKLLIFNVHLEDQGVYQCFTELTGFPSLHAGTSILFEASPPELVHTFISQSLQPGPSVSLKCSAVGNPLPTISWWIDGLLVRQGGGTGAASASSADYWNHHYSPRRALAFASSATESVSQLNISEIRVEDSGVYKCVASNLVGEAAHEARLNIYGPIFIKEMKELTLVAGGTASIPCLYGGYPVDKVIWQKDSLDVRQSLSQSRSAGSKNRFTILPNGTLQIERITTEVDKGRYSCLVSNRKGETAVGEVDVNVMRPPVISPFKFDENLKEGQRTSISCNVISGDLPIDIAWLKDGKRIDGNGGGSGSANVTENRVKFLSVLIFEGLTHEHSGEYECVAENAAQVVRQKAELRVKVPPKWTKEPKDARVILKSDHLLPCSAVGVPPPRISWSRDSSGIRSAIKSDHKFQVMEEGSLKILQVEETDATGYACEAVNGVGPGILRSIRLYVIIPAKVSASESSLVVAEGLAAGLKCQIRGDPPVAVSWKKDSIVIGSGTTTANNFNLRPRLQITSTVEPNSSGLISAELRIESSLRSDSGLYSCIASNQFGRDEDHISLEVKARPSPPENFMVEEIGSRYIRVRWSASSSSLVVPVTYFTLQWKKAGMGSSGWDGGGGQQISNISVPSPATTALIERLSPVTNYDVRLFGGNEFGVSFPTESLAVLTLPEAPSGSPQNVSAMPISAKSVIVRWQPPEVTLQHGLILGYQVTATLQLLISPGTNNNRSVVVDEKWETASELKGLRPNSQYRISVRAYNSAGMGPECSPVFIQTPEGAPDSPPLHLQCEPLSPKSLQVQWEPPPFHLSNGQILGYKVIYLPVPAEKMGEKPEVKKTSNRETTLHGLKSYTSYSVKTLAYTVGGESETSEPVVCTTEEDIPDEPADIKVVGLSGTSALVSWLPPSSPNGIITKYTIHWKPEDSESSKDKTFIPLGNGGPEEDQPALEIRRLRDNIRYMFWVTASTGSGTGKASPSQWLQLGPTVPARIASFPVLKNVVAEGSIRLPCRAIGSPSPRLSWTRNSSPLHSHSLLRNGSLFISRVKDSDEGAYLCRAENEHGWDEIEHRLIISRAPSAVPIFIGYVTDSSMQIHWDPPERADPPLTAYILQYHQSSSAASAGADGVQDWKSIRLSPRLTSYSVDNLSCGSPYSFRLAGENVVGRGEPSLVLQARTNGNPPESPRLTEILDGNGTMIRIDLSRWSDGGCPITNFHIEYKKGGGGGGGGAGGNGEQPGNWLRIYRKENSSRVFIFQTEPHSKYQIKIRVENDAGWVSKTFKVESHPDFFTNYAKVLERVEVEERLNGSYVSLYTDPHVLVPIVSAVICTFAIAVCVLMVVKRKNQQKSEWKFKQSSSQQTWLSSSDGGKCGQMPGENGAKCGEQGCGGNMSIYATLNSTKPIPMTIRDSTVRFQTFGQHDNYEAPAMMPGYLKRSRRKSSAGSPLDEICIQQVSCQLEFPKEIEPPREFRSSSIPSQQQQQQQLLHQFQHHHLQQHHQPNSDSDDHHESPSRRGVDDDGLYHDYSCPYQYTTAAGPDPRGREIDNQQGGVSRPSTLKKKEKSIRSRGSQEYFN